MAVDTVTSCSIAAAARWNVSKAVAGLTARADNETITKTKSFTLGAAVADKINSVYASLLTIAGAANTVLDLTALTDVLGNAVNFARVKGILIWLLAAGDTAPDGSVGSACSGITVGNAATNQWAGVGYPISDQATGTQTLGNGEFMVRGTGSATGWVVDGTHKSLKILNNDAVVSAKVYVVLLGADS